VVVEKRGNLECSLEGMLSRGEGGSVCELELSTCVDGNLSRRWLVDLELLGEE
jgi:hypothetical protein